MKRYILDPENPAQVTKSDLARIDRMKDSDIDYSDIPPLGDAFFTKEAVITKPPRRIKPSKALAAHRAGLRELVSRYDVKNPRIFGSVLTGTDDEESDLDLLVDATDTTTLSTLGGLEEEAQELLGVRVHISTPGNLAPKYRQRVIDEAEPLFGKKSERRNRNPGKTTKQRNSQHGKDG
jgi:uncharacterized protein